MATFVSTFQSDSRYSEVINMIGFTVSETVFVQQKDHVRKATPKIMIPQNLIEWSSGLLSVDWEQLLKSCHPN